jgi:hypothetical protein
VRRRVGASLLAAIVGLGAPLPAAPEGGFPDRTTAQAPAEAPGDARHMSFEWTLYPRMWAEVDLRLGASAAAVAEITVDGGEVSWNLHTHPSDAAPSVFQLLAQGVATRTTVRCAPETPGLYSYLFGNDRGAGPVRVRVEIRLTGDARLLAVKP